MKRTDETPKKKTKEAPIVEKKKVVRTREAEPIEEVPVKIPEKIEEPAIVKEVVKDKALIVEEPPIHLREKTRIKLKYRKIGGGSLRFRLEGKNTIIKPNQVFSAYPEDIPASFANVLQCLDDEEVQRLVISNEKQYHVKEALYEIREQAIGRYHVINGTTKKPVTPKAVDKEEAEKLRDSLNA